MRRFEPCVILRNFFGLLTLIGFLISGTLVIAQQGADAFADLLADQIAVDGDALVAQGNVVLRYQGQILRAQAVRYDQTREDLLITGPIILVDPDGTTIVAQEAQIGPALRNGILRSAQMIMDQQMQIAARQISRNQGRYNALEYAVASSCKICDDQRAPLWEIRARRIIHDKVERQLYFERAQLRFFDLPVFYFPKLRVPEPSVKRFRGFLLPSLISIDDFGRGLKMPYFIPIGDDKDITITPWVLPKTRTVELRYRQAFRNADLTINGAISQDGLKRGENRSYIFIKGKVNLPEDFKLSYDIEWASDESYLADYGFSGKSRLDSGAGITRFWRDQAIEAQFTKYTSLRNDEADRKIPSLVADFTWAQRYLDWPIAGETQLRAEIHSHYRSSDLDRVGRDIARISLDATWHRRIPLRYGLQLTGQAVTSLDYFKIAQDAALATPITRSSIGGSLALRWPLTRRLASGRRELLEPIWQIATIATSKDDAPAEESAQAEFDEGNLLALSRYPARDLRENGTSAAFGLRYRSELENAASYGLSLGKIFWWDKRDGFSNASGLNGDQSDFLLSAWFGYKSILNFSARALIDNYGQIDKAEGRISYRRSPFKINARYAYLQKDPLENRTQSISEWRLEGALNFARHWSISQSYEYDLVSDRTTKTETSIGYENECIAFRFGLERSFGKSENFRRKTKEIMTVALKGFSTGGKGGPQTSQL